MSHQDCKRICKISDRTEFHCRTVVRIDNCTNTYRQPYIGMCDHCLDYIKMIARSEVKSDKITVEDAKKFLRFTFVW